MIRIPPILLLTVLGAVAFFCVSRVHFSASIYELLPADLPEVQGMHDLNEFFNRDGELIVTVRTEESYFTDEASKSLAEYLRSKADLVAEVHEELALDQLAFQGGSMLAWIWLNSPPEYVADLAERLHPPQSAARIATSMAAVQEGLVSGESVISGYDPLGLAKLQGEAGEINLSETDPMSSPDGLFRILYLEGNGVDFSDYREAGKWLDHLKVAIKEWEVSWAAENVAVSIGLTGTPAFMAEVGREMERDMTLSMVGTMLLIALLFWIMHRQAKPLSWLIAAMLVVLSITIMLAGVIFGDLSVMSAGFGAILIGLAVDYGIVIYRESLGEEKTAQALRKTVGPGILWAAATTAVVFLSLNFSSLPGIAELGNLVAIGIFVGASVMLWGFAPVAVAFSRTATPVRFGWKMGYRHTRVISTTLAIAIPMLALISVLIKEMPGLEAQFHPFRIRESPSVHAWGELQHQLKGRENAIPITVKGATLPDLLKHLSAAKDRIKTAEDSNLLESWILPTALIPNPDYQRTNAAILKPLIAEESRLLGEIDAAGFSNEGATLTTEMFSSWKRALPEVAANGYALPSGSHAEWSLGRLFREKNGTFASLGTVKPADRFSRDWVESICDETTTAASLGSLGTALNDRIRGDMKRVFIPMICALAIMLGFVFRSIIDLALSLFCLAFCAAIMLILTIWTPLSWNSFNICGIPLLFGTGLDFSIHMIFALRRCKGDIIEARRGIGKALVFCGASSAIGFGSLAISAADGLSSLGIVCGLGIFINMIVAVWLLPRWYHKAHRM